MSKRILSALLLVIMTGCSSRGTQPNQPLQTGLFAASPQTQNLSKVRDEIIARWTKQFQSWDFNRDGKISWPEAMRAGLTHNERHLFDDLDVDQDGHVSLTEWMLDESIDRNLRDLIGWAADIMSRFDSNRNQFLDSKEYFAKKLPEFDWMSSPLVKKPDPQIKKTLFGQSDANRDMMLSISELEEAIGTAYGDGYDLVVRGGGGNNGIVQRLGYSIPFDRAAVAPVANAAGNPFLHLEIRKIGQTPWKSWKWQIDAETLMEDVIIGFDRQSDGTAKIKGVELSGVMVSRSQWSKLGIQLEIAARDWEDPATMPLIAAAINALKSY